MLRKEKRLSYRGLKRRFAPDDEYLEDLKEELIGAKRIAIDENGRFLVWTGGTTVVSFQLSVPNTQPLALNPQSEAEACFLKAIAIARKQQAKSLELRAVMGLVRLRQQRAAQDASRTTDPASRTTHHETHIRLDEAHRMLSEIYNWFTEGFDTKDLQEARALIEALSH